MHVSMPSFCRCRWVLRALLVQVASRLCSENVIPVSEVVCGLQICHHRSHLHSTAAAVSAARWLQQPWRRREWSALAGRQRQHSRSGRRRAAAASPQAMVNVDFSPALVLGLGMVAGGVLLYNVRVNRPWISRDYDVVISSVSVLVGGILVFQVGCCDAEAGAVAVP